MLAAYRHVNFKASSQIPCHETLSLPFEPSYPLKPLNVHYLHPACIVDGGDRVNLE